MSRDLLLRFLIATASSVMMTASLLAQTAEVASRRPAIDRIDLPASRQDDWPAGVDTLTPVSREEFVRLWKSSRPNEIGPVDFPIPAATFRGVLEGRELIGQGFSLSVERPTGKPAWLAFGPWTAALGQVRWTDGPAIWDAPPTVRRGCGSIGRRPNWWDAGACEAIRVAMTFTLTGNHRGRRSRGWRFRLPRTRC